MSNADGTLFHAVNGQHATPITTDERIMQAYEAGADPADLAALASIGDSYLDTAKLIQDFERLSVSVDAIERLDADEEEKEEYAQDVAKEQFLDLALDQVNTLLERAYQNGRMSAVRFGSPYQRSHFLGEALQLASEMQIQLVMLQQQLADINTKYKQERTVRKNMEAVLVKLQEYVMTPQYNPDTGERYYEAPRSFFNTEVAGVLFKSEKLDNPAAEYEEMGG